MDHSSSAKLKVSEDGIHRISWAALERAGYDFTGVPVSQFALTNNGGSIPIRIEGARDADDPFSKSVFGKGGYIDFIGEKNHTIYSDVNVYRLSLETDKALRIEEDFAEFDGADPVFANSYTETVVWGPDRKYSRVSSIDDPWYAAKLTALKKPVSRDFEIRLSDVDRSQEALVEVHVWAANNDPGVDPDHHVVLHVNGVRVGGSRFEGITSDVVKGRVGAGVLKNGNNTVQVTLPVNHGVTLDQIFIDRIEVHHNRRFVATGGALNFTTDEASSAVQVRGLSDQRVVAYRTDDAGTWRVKPRVRLTTSSSHIRD